MSRTSKAQKESSSKRLRGVMFILWTQNSQDFEEFEDYYEAYKESEIKRCKKLIK